VPGAGAEISVVASIPRQWVVVPVDIAGRITLYMVVDTGSPLSAISAGMMIVLTEMRFLDRIRDRLYLLRRISIAGQTLPDLEVHLSSRATRLGIQGILGLNFLQQFTEVRFRTADLLLMLVDP